MSSALSFDPGVAPAPFSTTSKAQISAVFTSEKPSESTAPGGAPSDWLHGMELLGDRHCPSKFPKERWDQIIRDCWAVISLYAPLVIEAGWSIENIFGYDPEGHSGAYGLAVALFGCRLVGFHETGEAIIRKEPGGLVYSGGGWRYHYPNMPAGAPLLWTFDERKL